MTYKTITTKEELNDLPEYSVVIDVEWDVSQKRGDTWCGYETANMSNHTLAKFGPLTVLWEPTA